MVPGILWRFQGRASTRRYGTRHPGVGRISWPFTGRMAGVLKTLRTVKASDVTDRNYGDTLPIP